MRRYTIAILAGVAAVAALMQWSSCGGGGSTTPAPTVPTISSVTGISSGTTTSATIATTGTTGVSVLTTNSLTITFSTAMDATTITTSTIGLSCGGTAQTITIANTNSPTNTIFTVTPSANLTQVTNCTLTIGTGVQSSDGGALAAEATYAYTTGCTVNDAFATDTITGGCWTAFSGNTGTPAISGGKMVLTPTSGSASSAAFEYKMIAPTGNVTTIVSIPTFSGLIRTVDKTSNCALNIMSSVSEFGTILTLQVSQAEDGGGQLVASVYNGELAAAATAILADSGTSSSDLSGTLYFKIVQTGSTTFTAFYSLDGSSYTQIGGAITGGAVVGSSSVVGLFAGNNAANQNISCSFANFSLTGATVTGQD